MRMRTLGIFLSGWALALTTACSAPNAPVTEGALVGKWERVDKRAITLDFRKDGTFSAHILAQPELSGKYRLLNGGQIILEFDNTRAKLGAVTNGVLLKGKELTITPAGGKVERYRRLD